MATLKLIDLGKRYGNKVWGARNINLEVKDKEFIVFPRTIRLRKNNDHENGSRT